MSRVGAHDRIGKQIHLDSTIDAEYAAAQRRASSAIPPLRAAHGCPLSPEAPCGTFDAAGASDDGQIEYAKDRG